jgi:Ca2+-binding EF-hand superfamily protein
MHGKNITITLIAITMGGGCAAQVDDHGVAAGRQQRVTLNTLSPRMQARFQSADANHDGDLSPQELAGYFSRRVRERFQKLDTNGDGRLDTNELAGHERVAASDRDGDGAVSLQEFTAAHDARWLTTIERADKNGDGVLTPKELGPVRWLRLHVADTDHDNQLTLDEIRSFGGH